MDLEKIPVQEPPLPFPEEEPRRSPAEAAGPPEPLSTEESCRRLGLYLEDILRDASNARLDAEGLSAPFHQLGEAMRSFQILAEQIVSYSTQLSKGNLELDFPESNSCLFGGLKNLHANLKHLTWQTGQVTKGDYSQNVSHLGQFSSTFNTMIRQLKVRESLLKSEIKLAQRRAEIIKGYTGMLVDLLAQRNEWLLVVDLETQEILHCNKRPQTGRAVVCCDGCDRRLSIQPELLKWDASEQYKIWEAEEQKDGVCYRVASFPVEWKDRSSCIHIITDVTEEKMNARLLKEDVYYDMDTGIRNRRFLEEFMSQLLRDRLDATLCYLDLEGVGEINAAYGYKAGDSYIQNFVDTVRKNFRSGDTFARVKDDKFCLVLSGAVKHLIERKMDEIISLFQQNEDRVFNRRCNFRYHIIEIEGEENRLTCSELLKKAASAVQKAKETARQKRFILEDW